MPGLHIYIASKQLKGEFHRTNIIVLCTTHTIASYFIRYLYSTEVAKVEVQILVYSTPTVYCLGYLYIRQYNVSMKVEFSQQI